MDDDKQDRAGALPGGDAGKRKPPTIDLAASEVIDNSPASSASEPSAAAPEPAEAAAEATAESQASSAPRASRAPSMILSAVAGVVAAGLVLGGAKLSGLLDAPPLTNIASKSDVEALGARIATVETAAAKPAPAPRPVADPAMTARIAAVEKSLATLRDDIAAARNQSDKAVAAIGEIKSAAPQVAINAASPAAPAIDTSAIEERLGKIERAAAALSAAAAAPTAPQPSAEDPAMRKVAAAALLDSAVRQGEPYAPALAVARAVAGNNADVLKPLDGFAATGVPAASVLSRELLALLPKLAPKADAPPPPSGIVERLQQSALKLVRIQRVDAAANPALARVAAAAQRDDVSAAKRELVQIPAQDRAPAQAWIAKVEARDAALAASRQFASDTMTALSKPAR